MCGIVGYIGNKKCKAFILEGLSRLEYRGYDSAGFACIDANHKRLSYAKKTGDISFFKKELKEFHHDGFIGFGHTRWATHGSADDNNAHPHFSCNKNIALIHNGIIESYSKIREKLLLDGHAFYSETDSEVVVHLFEEIVKSKKDSKEAVIELVKQLNGVYALVFLMEEDPEQLILVRYKSPLAIGIGKDEMFTASDPIAFSDRTDKVLFLPDKSFALLKKDSIELYDFDGNSLPVVSQKLDVKFNVATKHGFEHFMLKEIYEQKKAIDRTISFYKTIGNTVTVGQRGSSVLDSDNFLVTTEYSSDIWGQLGISEDKAKALKSVHMVAAGTSWHACRIAQFYFEEICKIPSHVHLASEFSYRPFFPPEDSLFILVSQSGETADTLEAMRRIKSNNIPTVALTNSPSSTMVREADGFLLMQAGPEIAVASTKAFTCQLASLYWLAHRVALEKEIINSQDMKKSEDDLFVAAEILETSIEEYKWEISTKLAPKYSKYERFIFLGRHVSYPLALEGGLKLKEISYRFAQCYPAGELKHGPIALVDKDTPVIIFSVSDDLIYQKIVSNAQEIAARNGHLVVFAFEGQDELIKLADTAFVVPKVDLLLCPLAFAGVLQFFIYHITKQLGLPIDKPRNLAKSVTVE
jgi:glutamine---fructose-6-phosphate transaminase (isomerizing)